MEKFPLPSHYESQPWKAHHEVLQDMPDNLQNLRQRILEQIPNRNERYHPQQIQEFFAEKNLRTTDYLVVDYAATNQLDPLLQEVGTSFEVYNSLGVQGQYLAELDLVLVAETGPARSHPPLFTEGVIVHELGHATSQYSDQLRYPDPETQESHLITPRGGFALYAEQEPRGTFFEEGFSEFLSGHYKEIYSTQDDLTFLLERSPYSRASTLKEAMIIGTGQSHTNLPIPLKYTYPSDFHSLQYATAAPAATALELLCMADTTLEQTAYDSRVDINALRTFVQKIDNLMPESYQHLSQLPYTNDDFEAGLEFVLLMLFNGTSPLPNARFLGEK